MDRCGKEIRYIIDFYPGQPAPGTTLIILLIIAGKLSSVYVDVRPELTMEGALDRAKLYFKQKFED